jgi:hypothetical protein
MGALSEGVRAGLAINEAEEQKRRSFREGSGGYKSVEGTRDLIEKRQMRKQAQGMMTQLQAQMKEAMAPRLLVGEEMRAMEARIADGENVPEAERAALMNKGMGVLKQYLMVGQDVLSQAQASPNPYFREASKGLYDSHQDLVLRASTTAEGDANRRTEIAMNQDRIDAQRAEAEADRSQQAILQREKTAAIERQSELDREETARYHKGMLDLDQQRVDQVVAEFDATEGKRKAELLTQAFVMGEAYEARGFSPDEAQQHVFDHTGLDIGVVRDAYQGLSEETTARLTSIKADIDRLERKKEDNRGLTEVDAKLLAGLIRERDAVEGEEAVLQLGAIQVRQSYRDKSAGERHGAAAAENLKQFGEAVFYGLPGYISGIMRGIGQQATGTSGRPDVRSTDVQVSDYQRRAEESRRRRARQDQQAKRMRKGQP